ncbi:hypothetical protein [Paenibacillus amylolyticus]|uniref:hypothetical protein n=1 Tax=Paenibacillus amylolyticus TaxID=1451 RepID=UPI000FDCD083|nr:hypothetical protein [Paenibacillus amylolyticus]
MKVTVMVKNGGCENLQISPDLLGKLAKNIVVNGSEFIHTMSKSVEVVGILVKGDQIGDRVIITGNRDPELAPKEGADTE